MIIIGFIAYAFWAILGLFFWVPLLVRVVAAFCGTLAYNMVIHNPGAIQKSRISLELAITFYSKGFKVISETIFEPDKKVKENPVEDFHLVSFIGQLAWTIIFWGILFLPFFKTNFTFFKSYVFKEEFENNANQWYTRESESDNIKVNNGKLYVNCKDNPKDQNYGRTSVTNNNINLYNCPGKYTIQAKFELLNGDYNRSYGLLIGDKSNNDLYFDFGVRNDNLGYVNATNNGKYDNLFEKKIKTKSNSRNYEIEIAVKGNDFEYFLNDTKIGNGAFQGFTPYSIRPFVSRGQIVEFDYLRIIK